jgi:DNA-binding IclR family transcriptional regulator
MREDDHQAQQNDGISAEVINRSVTRAMALLKELGNHPEGATAQTLAAATGLNRATASRLLLSLAHAGIVSKSDSVFTLGWEIARLGRVADPYRGALPHLQVILERLSTELDEHVSFSVVMNATTLEVIAEAYGSYMLGPTQGYVGMKFPLHASATGKVLLGEMTDEQVTALLPEKLDAITQHTMTERDALLNQLDDVRSVGYATIDNEIEEGLFSVAVGVRDGAGGLIGVIAASGLDRRMKRSGVDHFVGALQAAAYELSEVFSSTST